MMGQHEGQKALFSYQVDLDRRVRADHPLRAVRSAVDFGFVRPEVARFYGYNGNESVDPAVILKLMFLLFWDGIRSERELMRMLPERLDYLWFLGFGLDDEIPDHSVLSKARARWGREVFESLFVRTVQQCVSAGLVDGSKLHLDGSLVEAQASKDSVVRSSPELISALKQAYAVEERKLEGNLGDPDYQPVNQSLCSTTDPDAPCVRQNKQGGRGDSRPRYKHHRAVDDRCGVITAVVTTPGDIPEPTQTMPLIAQHEQNTRCAAAAIVADQQYGTIANYRDLQHRGLATHMAPMHSRHTDSDLIPREQFVYDSEQNLYTCPAGQTLHPRRFNERRQATEYATRKGVCAACPLRAQCTRSKSGRTLMRHYEHELIARAWSQARSAQARRDRWRRRYLMEGSFAQAANLHHFKRARWRRLWRQQIQDWLIAACQNIKLLLRHARPKPSAAGTQSAVQFGTSLAAVQRSLRCFSLSLRTLAQIGFRSLHPVSG
jgi:transposase